MWTVTLLRGKEIVVTGAASGIGAETVNELKRDGASVIGVDIRDCPNVDLAFRADLSDPASIDQLVEELPSGLNGLCNVAGLPPTEPRDLVLKVNVLGLKRLSCSLIEKLADGASITNVASLAGIGWPDDVPAIKAFNRIDDFDAVEGFCEEHRIEGARSYFFSKEVVVVWTMQNRWTWRDRGIRMNAVSPGPVQTPILKDFIATLGERVEEDMRLMDRIGRPQDIAPVIAFLQSDEARWFRGANLTPDGGLSPYILCKRNDLLEE